MLIRNFKHENYEKYQYENNIFVDVSKKQDV